MKQIISMAQNTFYHKNDKGEYERMHEIVLVLTEPQWAADEAGFMGKKRSVETIRFTAFDEQLITIANTLMEYATAD